MTETGITPRGETFFLNLRFLLIVCVFVGNAIEPLMGRIGGMAWLYTWIFTFHMPLFVFVTGYFAKANLLGEAGRKVLLQIGLQYVIFQSLYSLLDAAVFHVNGIHRSFFAPYLLLWFLASHLGWRLIQLMLRKWPALHQLAFSIALAVLAGYLPVDGSWLSLSRTFVYLPFFIAGYHFSFERMERLLTRKVRLAAIALSLAWFGLIALGGADIAPGWLYGSMTYGQLGHPEWYAGVFRLLLYPLQLFAGIVFWGFVPAKKSKVTEMGRHTLYVFLLHGFIVRLAAVSPLYAAVRSLPAALGVVAGAVALTWLLTRRWVRMCSSPLIEPPVSWLLKLERRAFRQVGATGKHS